MKTYYDSIIHQQYSTIAELEYTLEEIKNLIEREKFTPSLTRYVS
jgi:hypothetical protein